MPDLVHELADRGRALPPEDRVRLLDLLLESLHSAPVESIDQAWNAEIERRVAAYDAGHAELVDADVVLAEAARLAP
jgi:putative addiction module component (TIGR02574 family)